MVAFGSRANGSFGPGHGPGEHPRTDASAWTLSPMSTSSLTSMSRTPQGDGRAHGGRLPIRATLPPRATTTEPVASRAPRPSAHWRCVASRETIHEGPDSPRLVSSVAGFDFCKIRVFPSPSAGSACSPSEQFQRAAAPIQTKCCTRAAEDETRARCPRCGKGGVAEPPAPEIHAAAAAAWSSTGAALPFAATIQAAFGRHDVSHVGAHIGGAAGEVARQLGALAFTSGAHIGFRAPPTLHLASHEAAHVIQQRAGLRIPNNRGASGDVWERHADAVADAVVAGHSAEHLLDRVAPPRMASLAGCPPVLQAASEGDRDPRVGGCVPPGKEMIDATMKHYGDLAHDLVQSHAATSFGLGNELQIPRATKKQVGMDCPPQGTTPGYADLFLVGEGQPVRLELAEIKPDHATGRDLAISETLHYMKRTAEVTRRRLGKPCREGGVADGTDRAFGPPFPGRPVYPPGPPFVALLNANLAVGVESGPIQGTAEGTIRWPYVTDWNLKYENRGRGFIAYWCKPQDKGPETESPAETSSSSEEATQVEQAQSGATALRIASNGWAVGESGLVGIDLLPLVEDELMAKYPGAVGRGNEIIVAAGYDLVPHVMPDATDHIVYYTAYNRSMGRIEYVVGPQQLPLVIEAANPLAFIAFSFFGFSKDEPPPWIVESARVERHLFQMRFWEAFKAFGRAWSAAVTDPEWWAFATVSVLSEATIQGKARPAARTSTPARLPLPQGSQGIPIGEPLPRPPTRPTPQGGGNRPVDVGPGGVLRDPVTGTVLSEDNLVSP